MSLGALHFESFWVVFFFHMIHGRDGTFKYVEVSHNYPEYTE